MDLKKLMQLGHLRLHFDKEAYNPARKYFCCSPKASIWSFIDNVVYTSVTLCGNKLGLDNECDSFFKCRGVTVRFKLIGLCTIIHLGKYARIRLSSDSCIPAQGHNLWFWPYMGKYGSQKTRFLAYSRVLVSSWHSQYT